MSDTAPQAPDTAPSRPTWRRILLSPFATLIALGLAVLLFVNVGNSARFDDHWLRYSADHVRAQMTGSPSDQIDRTVLPPRTNLIVYRGWTTHEDDQWAMCLNTGEVDDDNETRHLTFTATGPYQIHDGACPSKPTLTVPH